MNVLQIGCNNANDKVSKFLSDNKKNISKALLVDASPSALELARKFYKDFSFIDFKNVAVVDNDKTEVDLFYPINSPESGHCSILEEHVKTHKEIEGRRDGRDPEKVEKLKVPAVRVNNLLDYFNGEYIDRLYVDIEGLDCAIINDIDLRKYDIGYIRFEHTHSEKAFTTNGPTLKKTLLRAMDAGYTVIKDQNCEEDLVLIKDF